MKFKFTVVFTTTDNQNHKILQQLVNFFTKFDFIEDIHLCDFEVSSNDQEKSSQM